MAPTSLRDCDLETEEEEVGSGPLGDSGVETAGNLVDKTIAVRIWRDIVDHSGIDDKVLAIECGMSKSHFSKVAAGEQGCLLGLAFLVGRRRPELRREFVARLAEHEGVDPTTVAAEQMVISALRYLRLRGVRVPAPKRRMAKATI